MALGDLRATTSKWLHALTLSSEQYVPLLTGPCETTCLKACKLCPHLERISATDQFLLHPG